MRVFGWVIAAVFLICRTAEAADVESFAAAYASDIRPLVLRYCGECHSADLAEAEVDLTAFPSLGDVRKHPRVWQQVREMLDSGQMPPKDARQPSDAERQRLQKWVREYLTAEAAARAGDPGRVVLRRLNNAEYTYTLRDLTGVATLDPAHEFPVDGAAGEGFTNTGNALAMSPALVTKYLDAAKDVAAHAVLLPDGFRFSPAVTRRDWTEERLARIRSFYGRYADAAGGTAVNLQGIQFETNQGGRLAVEQYLAATLVARDDLRAGRTTIAAVARDRGLNAKYLGTLWEMLTTPSDGSSLLLDRLRSRWQAARPDDAAAIAADIAQWQRSLWKFNAVGQIGTHLGRKDGPQSWMESVTPLITRQDVRLKLAPPADQSDVALFLSATDAGDGNEHDFVVWEHPRFVAPGRPDLPLRDVREAMATLAAYRERVAASAARCLTVAARIEGIGDAPSIADLAKQHELEPEILAAWIEYLGLGGVAARINSYVTQPQRQTVGQDFIQGWMGADALGVLANSSDLHVRVPGHMKPHGIAVHPTPSLRMIAGWRCPVLQTLRIDGAVQHAHPECGNGVTWSLELRRGSTRQRLAGGVAHGPQTVTFGPLDNVVVRPGDLIALSIGARDRNHSCDLTAVDLTLKGDGREWSLAADVSPDLLAGNPHDDRQGHKDVWHFFSEPDTGETLASIPTGSLVARWQAAASTDDRDRLAADIQALLQRPATDLPNDSPDAALHRQLTSLNGPLLATVRNAVLSQGRASPASRGDYGLDPALFGRHPDGSPVEATSLCLAAPHTLEVRLPRELVEGCEFVAAATLHRPTGVEGSVQCQVATAQPAAGDLFPQLPILVAEGSAARRRFETTFADVRNLFPAALCYTKIVPVDEVVTLTLFYREDDALRRLMLDDAEAAELDRLWDELLFVSQEPFLLATAFEQLVEFATQDRPDLVKAFDPMRGPVNDRATAFRQRLIDAEPKQLDALIEFAGRAYRRPIAAQETDQLRQLYAALRRQELPHDEAFRLTLARVLVSPAFLYHLEEPPPGTAQRPVSGHEFANRLSYFLWSSMPDDELLHAAATGDLQREDVRRSQLHRMLRDPRTRRLAHEFGGQWLHIHDFARHDEKSERHFPTFTGLREAMAEESILFFTELFQSDGSVLSLLDADHTFLNEDLAKHYGIPNVIGPEWRRVNGVRPHARGGILTQATTLATQSGASRTSPILRGNWLSEVVLGEKLPRPPKNVPQLAESPPEGLTERQLIEQHSRDAACAKCHARIDPLGFALENFDAIGRYRTVDAGGLPINSQTQLADGTPLNGFDGLRTYLLATRRDAFVRQFNRKLLGYALGRAVQLSDEPLLDAMHADLVKREFRVSAALDAIVLSRQFREIRGRDVADQE